MPEPSNNSALYRGRFAPSPTGPMHFGSLVSAVASFLQARSHQGTWLVRIEDIDPPREIPGSSDSILRTLEQHELFWDEPVLFQSQQIDRYHAALDTLHDNDRLYLCQCSRKTIAEVQQSTGTSVYPGTCRNLNIASGNNCATRVVVDDQTISITDRIQGNFTQNLVVEVGDFVLRRVDSLFAYQLAVVVDDAFQQITEVVRGSDLLDNTPRQVLLQRYLDLPHPDYAHHPVATNAKGEKLSKQTFAVPVDNSSALSNIHKVLDFLGQNPPAETEFIALSNLWDWAVQHCKLEKIPRVMGISVGD